MSELYVTGDTHFHHSRMATHYRPYESVEQMNEQMVEAWNDLIRPTDVVWHVGDFSFGSAEKVKEVYARLHGEKHLIVGNHDSNAVKRLGWASVHDLHKLKAEGKRYWLCHYPLLTWPNAHKGTWHLHGHSHGNLQAPISTRMDVGVDATGVIAMPIEEVAAILAQRQYDFVDHHD